MFFGLCNHIKHNTDLLRHYVICGVSSTFQPDDECLANPKQTRIIMNNKNDGIKMILPKLKLVGIVNKIFFSEIFNNKTGHEYPRWRNV